MSSGVRGQGSVVRGQGAGCRNCLSAEHGGSFEAEVHELDESG